MGKDIIIHLIANLYCNLRLKLPQMRYYKWMGFLQQFHLIIKYKKWTTNELDDFISKKQAPKIRDVGATMYHEA